MSIVVQGGGCRAPSAAAGRSATVTVLDDRIEMAEADDEPTLDTMFEWLEAMPVPEGFRAEVVGGNIYMSPQRHTHWEIIAAVYEQLRTRYPRQRTG